VERLKRRLLELADYAAEKGLEAIFLEQMYTSQLKPYTVAEGKEFIEELNQKSAVPFYMHLDTGHMAAAPKDDADHTDLDKDPFYWLAQNYGNSEKVFVHLQQTDREASRHWPFTEEYNKLGFIEAEKVIRSVEASGVKEAYFSFEILYPRGTDMEEIVPGIVESVRYFDDAFRRLGYAGNDGVYTKEKVAGEAR